MGLAMYTFLVSLWTAIPLGAVVGAAKTYQIQDWYGGQDFFNDWYFFTGTDPTNGNVDYLDMNDARSQGLAYVNSTDGTFVMAIDSMSDVPAGGRRNSVRIQSYKSYNGGLFVLDAIQMPVGCGTWPAFWTNGPHWPQAGEIDIVEGTNGHPQNQMTLHSWAEPCMINLTSSKGTYTGRPLHADCYSTQNSDSGCSILDADTHSFGNGFNAAEGGVFVLLWDANVGMSIWFFPRMNIPADLANKNPTPANWGTPAGFWSAETCDIAHNFYDHSMIIDTTICGWAGSTYNQFGCPGTCSDMVANKSNFVNAKWVIRYVAVYQCT